MQPTYNLDTICIQIWLKYTTARIWPSGCMQILLYTTARMRPSGYWPRLSGRQAAIYAVRLNRSLVLYGLFPVWSDAAVPHPGFYIFQIYARQKGHGRYTAKKAVYRQIFWPAGIPACRFVASGLAEDALSRPGMYTGVTQNLPARANFAPRRTSRSPRSGIFCYENAPCGSYINTDNN